MRKFGCLYVCLLLDYVDTTEPIAMKFGKHLIITWIEVYTPLYPGNARKQNHGQRPAIYIEYLCY